MLFHLDTQVIAVKYSSVVLKNVQKERMWALVELLHCDTLSTTVTDALNTTSKF